MREKRKFPHSRMATSKCRRNVDLENQHFATITGITDSARINNGFCDAYVHGSVWLSQGCSHIWPALFGYLNSILGISVRVFFFFFFNDIKTWNGLSSWLGGKESTCQCRRHGFHLWVRKIPWRRKWQLTPTFLPGKSQGQRSLAGYSSISCIAGGFFTTEPSRKP